MLLELRAENYAVIDHAVAVFGPGLNLLTGETGAGKSILVDALALLMGGRASADVVRHGAERAVVACVFESTPGAEATLEANSLDADGAEIILRREIFDNGKGRVYVNNQPATVAFLRQLAPELALIHAQSETLGAFDAAQQRGLLDRFAGIADSGVAEVVSTAFARWREISDRLGDLQRDEQQRLRAADLWSFQSKEIADVRPLPGEDETLEAEKRVLANAEKLYAAAMSAYDLLYESGNSAEGALRSAGKHLDELARYDARFIDLAQQLASARAIVEDASATARDYAQGIQASPERLAEIEDRLALLDRLKRKYGSTLAEVIGYGKEMAAKLAEIDNRDEILKGLQAELKRAAESYRSAASALSAERSAAAKRLEKLAEKQINDLAMKAKFAVHVTSKQEETEWSANGWDIVDCLIATNPGEPLKPLNQIASGGEMSRVLLALKVSVEEGANSGASRSDSSAGRPGGKRKTAVPRTLVFDEIDIGIGGGAAEAVGQKLKALSRAQQVLCVTHLPQIAAFADQHFLIEKREHRGRTKTEARLIEDAERTQEIARMLSGAAVTEISMKHAEQMLRASR